MTPARFRVRRGIVLAFLGFPLVAVMPRTAHADELTSLIDRADQAFRGKTSAAVLSMDVKTERYSRHYKLVIWDDARGKDKTLVKILGPTSFRGFATLKVGNQLKLYDPKTNHVQVVGSSMLADSWMGSHFSNDDLVKETRLAYDYAATLVEKHGGKDAAGRPATIYRIKLLPKPTAPVVWGRIEFELSDGGGKVMPIKSTYFTRAADQKPARALTFSVPKELGGRLVPTVLEVRVADKPGEYTRLTYEELRFDIAIPESKFTEQALR